MLKVVLAVDHDEIEAYVADRMHISEITVIKSKSELINQLKNNNTDIVILAHDLPGEEDMTEIIKQLVAMKTAKCRIVYIYGEDDHESAAYVRFLYTNGIYDVLVGNEISSLDIDRALYGPSRDKLRQWGADRKQNSLFLQRLIKIFKEKSNERNSRFSIKGMKKPVITLISNHATGKTHTAWNLIYCISKKGCISSLINIDRGYSANYCFGIEDMYHELLEYVICRNEHHSIMDKCYKNRKLNIISGRSGDTNGIKQEDFEKLLYHIRARSDITLVDTYTGAGETTKSAIKHSNMDLMIFDNNLHHYALNLKMMDELKENFIPEKTIAVINNTDIRSQSFKWIYHDLEKRAIPFIDICAVSSFGLNSCDMALQNVVPYEAATKMNNRFAEDMDRLAKVVCYG